MSKKIVVIGSANTDMVVKSDKFPEPGETLLGGDFFIIPGGKGANQAVAAARLGGDVSFVCRVGDDDFGRRSIEGYKKEAICTDYIVVDPERPTGVAMISVDGKGENKIVVAPGANDGFTKQEIERAKKLLSEAGIIILQLEIPLEIVGHILKLAKQGKTRVILNPAPAQPLPEWYYDNLFLITPNETEAEQLTGIPINDTDSALKAAEWFQSKGVQNVVITMGSSGAFMVTTDHTGLLPAPQTKAVDTTAAGDVFNGALAVALIQGRSWEVAVRFACAAAAVSVSKIGAQSSSPTIEELHRFSVNLSDTPQNEGRTGPSFISPQGET